MNNTSLAPIVLFVYNRPWHTQQTVAALQKNELANQSELFIYSDAAKNDSARQSVEEVRAFIKNIHGFKKITVIERADNWGLANSIIDGVTTVINQYGKVIVLEDDLIVTPHFLAFMNRTLDKYETEPQVIQVSGYMFPITIETEEDALFLPLTTSWGWGTWKRAWELFDPEAKGYARVKADLKLRKQFNLDGAYDYFSMLEAQLAGKVDSWAVRWQLSSFLNNKLTVYPKTSLIVNAGFDGSGTHGLTLGLLTRAKTNGEFDLKKFPEEIKVSDSWKNVCQALKNRWTILDRIKRRAHLIISRLTKIAGIST